MSLFSSLFPRRASKAPPALSPFVRGLIASIEATPDEWMVVSLSSRYQHKATGLTVIREYCGLDCWQTRVMDGPVLTFFEQDTVKVALNEMSRTKARASIEERKAEMAPVVARFVALGAQLAPAQSSSTQGSS